MNTEQVFNHAELLVSSAHGIYTYQILAQQYGEYFVDAGRDEWDILFMKDEENVHTEQYLWIAEKMLDTIIVNDKGEKATIFMVDGDIWAIPSNIFEQWEEEE